MARYGRLPGGASLLAIDNPDSDRGAGFGKGPVCGPPVQKTEYGRNAGRDGMRSTPSR